jgi:predicted membrane GTPase involved in stress response
MILFVSFGLAQVKKSKQDRDLEALISTLENSVFIPIRLPNSLNLFVTPQDEQVFVRVGEIRTEVYSGQVAEPQYSIVIENSKNCRASRVCLLGIVSGLSKVSEEFRDEENKAKIINLENGIKGFHLEGMCGTSCSLDIIMWKQNGFYYEVRAANLKILRQIANQMIRSNPIEQ